MTTLVTIDTRQQIMRRYDRGMLVDQVCVMTEVTAEKVEALRTQPELLQEYFDDPEVA